MNHNTARSSARFAGKPISLQLQSHSHLYPFSAPWKLTVIMFTLVISYQKDFLTVLYSLSEVLNKTIILCMFISATIENIIPGGLTSICNSQNYLNFNNSFPKQILPHFVLPYLRYNVQFRNAPRFWCSAHTTCQALIVRMHMPQCSSTPASFKKSYTHEITYSIF